MIRTIVPVLARDGNQATRPLGVVTLTLGYDAESRMVSVSGTGFSASFAYDSDGQRVKSTIAGVTTKFVGGYYEVTGSTVNKYYSFGGGIVATRQGGVLYYPLTDHLGSTTVTTNTGGAKVSELRYSPFGKTRYTYNSTPTKYQFTGQYSNVPEFGLYFFNARWFDSYNTHFSSPDTVIADNHNSLDIDRYQYARSNHLKYTDPSGHMAWEGDGGSEHKYKFHDRVPEFCQRSLDCLNLKETKYPSLMPKSNPGEECNKQQEGKKALDPKDPDYEYIMVNGGELVSGGVVYAWDRYKRHYFGFVAGVGKSLTGISGSFARGWIGDPLDNHYPSEVDTKSCLDGLSINGSVGVLGGGGDTFSPASNVSQLGSETGFYIPQIGISILLITQFP